MDSNWISAIVAILALGSTLTLALVNRHDAAARERSQFAREDAKEKAEEQRAQRAVERESVLTLSGIFADTRRWAERPEEEDPDGMDWDEDFPPSWESSYDRAMRASELVSDKEFRDVFQECTQAIISNWSLSRAGGGPGRLIARETADLGFKVAGSWLRNEATDSDSREQIVVLRNRIRAADEMWEANALRSAGEEP